jgi:hypothetical protein
MKYLTTCRHMENILDLSVKWSYVAAEAERIPDFLS